VRQSLQTAGRQVPIGSSAALATPRQGALAHHACSKCHGRCFASVQQAQHSAVVHHCWNAPTHNQVTSTPASCRLPDPILLSMPSATRRWHTELHALLRCQMQPAALWAPCQPYQPKHTRQQEPTGATTPQTPYPRDPLALPTACQDSPRQGISCRVAWLLAVLGPGIR
jgi:hypothetical protein